MFCRLRKRCSCILRVQSRLFLNYFQSPKRFRRVTKNMFQYFFGSNKANLPKNPGDATNRSSLWPRVTSNPLLNHWSKIWHKIKLRNLDLRPQKKYWDGLYSLERVFTDRAFWILECWVIRSIRSKRCVCTSKVQLFSLLQGNAHYLCLGATAIEPTSSVPRVYFFNSYSEVILADLRPSTPHEKMALKRLKRLTILYTHIQYIYIHDCRPCS
jgi:hypothetical protein